MKPHDGYRDGEVPAYEHCACGQTVRADRLDLLREHLEVCWIERCRKAGLDVLRLQVEFVEEVRVKIPMRLADAIVKAPTFESDREIEAFMTRHTKASKKRARDAARLRRAA